MKWSGFGKCREVIRDGKRAGLKPPAQNVKAHWARVSESVSTDFHELRQGFIPPKHNPPYPALEDVQGLKV